MTAITISVVAFSGGLWLREGRRWLRRRAELRAAPVAFIDSRRSRGL